MTHTLLLIAQLFCVGVVMVRCVCVASKMSRKEWRGHPLQFIGIAAYYTLLAGGVFGMVAGLKAAPWLLVSAIVVWILFDPRRGHCRDRRCLH